MKILTTKEGGVKTSIFLFAILVTVSLLLFLFVQSIYTENKNLATKNLLNVNACIDISFEIVNKEINETKLTFQIINNPNSIEITKLTLVSLRNSETKELSILPGQTKDVIFENMDVSSGVQIYANQCDELSKNIVI